jgi:hypothetical protein
MTLSPARDSVTTTCIQLRNTHAFLDTARTTPGYKSAN